MGVKKEIVVFTDTDAHDPEPVSGLTAEDVVGHCCICAEGVTDEYLSGGCFYSDGHENGSKRAIVVTVRGVLASKWRVPRG